MRRVSREELAAMIDAELGSRCRVCLRHPATDEDWAVYEEGDGEHLCWEPGECGISGAATEGSVLADLPVFAELLTPARATLSDRKAGRR